MEEKKKNTVGLIAMIFSIVWLLCTLTILLSPIGFPLLALWLVLGIIWLFSKPRGKAITAVVISAIVFGASARYLSLAKVPGEQYAERLNANYDAEKLNQLNNETLQSVISNEMNIIIKDKINDPESILSELESSEWNNIFEKSWYVFFNILQQSTEKWFPEYEKMVEEWTLPTDVDVEDENTIEDEDTTEPEITNEDENTLEEESTVENEDRTEADVTNEDTVESENPDEEVIFSAEEQNEIQEIVELLE